MKMNNKHDNRQTWYTVPFYWLNTEKLNTVLKPEMGQFQTDI